MAAKPSPYARIDDDRPLSMSEAALASVAPLLPVPFFASVVGFASGAVSGGKLSSLQFRAENAHRLPRNKQEWYFYYKTRNYRVILGAVKAGAWTGTRLAAWTATFVAVKEVVAEGLKRTEARKELEGRLQLIGGAVGGLAIAIGAGIIYRLKPRLSPRRMLFGTGIGAMAGGFEDLRAVAHRHTTAA